MCLNRGHVAVSSQPVHGGNKGAFQGQIALPQAEYERITRQITGHPSRAQSALCGELLCEKTLCDPGIAAPVLDIADQVHWFRFDDDLRIRRAQPGGQRNTVKTGR